MPTTLDHIRLAHRGVQVRVFRLRDGRPVIAPQGAPAPPETTHASTVRLQPPVLTGTERSLDDLRWYLHRALQYVDAGDTNSGLDSLMNDLHSRRPRPGDDLLYGALRVQDCFRLLEQGRAAVTAWMIAAGIGPPRRPGEPFVPGD